MVYTIVEIFLFASLILYVLLGGADFGAGVIQFFAPSLKEEKVIAKAIGPVWEANHMWLIIAIVVLFMGFPKIYITLSIALHIPLSLILLGIIVRGTAYTFKHYDAIKDEKSQKIYQQLFTFSSVWTSLLLGITFGAVFLGRIDLNATNFYDAYIANWFNLFCFMVGVFVMAIFAFLAAVYLIGENKEPSIQHRFSRKAAIWLGVAIIAGLLAFGAGEYEGLPMFALFIGNTWSMLLVFVAMGSLPLLLQAIRKEWVLGSRLLAGGQIVLILGAWLFLHYPNAIRLVGGNSLTLMSAQAPHATLSVLAWALLIGSLFILPALFYLYKVFKLTDESVSNNS